MQKEGTTIMRNIIFFSEKIKMKEGYLEWMDFRLILDVFMLSFMFLWL